MQRHRLLGDHRRTLIWDLARATGQLDKLDPSLAGPALEGARAMIKHKYRNMVEPGAPFGAKVRPRAHPGHWSRDTSWHIA
jgi:hypothetical protein